MDSLHIRCPHCKNKIFEVGVLIVEQVESWYTPTYDDGDISWGDRELGDPSNSRIQCNYCSSTIEELTTINLIPILRDRRYVYHSLDIDQIEQYLRVKGA